MRAALVTLVLVHGAIHLLGFVQAFGLAKATLHAAIGRPLGVVWLIVGIGFLASAALLFTDSKTWAYVALPTVIASQALIVSTWSEAWFGTIANVIVLAAIVVSFLDRSPNSLRSTYQRELQRSFADRTPTAALQEADLATLPPLIAAYVRRTGAVGRPRIHDVHVTWRAQMRRSPDGQWMELGAEQYDLLDGDPVRLFFMEGKMYGLPFVGLHRYAAGEATMRVHIASALPIVDGKGSEMNQSETVTLFNDICMLAPAALVDANVRWETLDAHRVRGTFTNAGSTISAELTFDDAGDLVGFVSRDRYESADGKTYRSYPWSTPLSDYRDFGGVRIASRGDALWLRPEGAFVYGRFVVESVDYNVSTDAAPHAPTSAPLPSRSSDAGAAMPSHYGT